MENKWSLDAGMDVCVVGECGHVGLPLALVLGDAESVYMISTSRPSQR